MAPLGRRRRIAALLCALAGASGTRLVRRLSPALSPRASLSTLSASRSIASGDHMSSAISADGSISAKAIITSSLVGEATRLQGLGGLAAAALGRALTCSLLIADGLKDDETFQVNFNGDGPLRGVMATANGALESRGYVGNPAVRLPPNAMGKLDVGAGVGAGTLAVVRTKHLPGADTPTQYSSITQIRSGEIPEDINYYLLESEQRQGALAAGVFVSSSGDEPAAGGDDAAVPMANGELEPPPASAGVRVEAAGGWYVQLLPFASEEAITRLEANIGALQSRSPTSLVREGLAGRDVVELLLDGLEPQFAPDRRVKSLTESCPCSEERVLRTMALIPREEMQTILESNEVIEAKCEFCGTLYRSTPNEVRERLASRDGKSD